MAATAAASTKKYPEGTAASGPHHIDIATIKRYDLPISHLSQLCEIKLATFILVWCWWASSPSFMIGRARHSWKKNPATLRSRTSLTESPETDHYTFLHTSSHNIVAVPYRVSAYLLSTTHTQQTGTPLALAALLGVESCVYYR